MSGKQCLFPSEKNAHKFDCTPEMKTARKENGKLRARIYELEDQVKIKDERIELLSARLDRATAAGFKMIDGKK